MLSINVINFNTNWAFMFLFHEKIHAKICYLNGAIISFDEYNYFWSSSFFNFVLYTKWNKHGEMLSQYSKLHNTNIFLKAIFRAICFYLIMATFKLTFITWIRFSAFRLLRIIYGYSKRTIRRTKRKVIWNYFGNNWIICLDII